ncbi:hypothetical protein D3C73_1461110 [compost metagenome]
MELGHDLRVIGSEGDLGGELVVAEHDLRRGEHAAGLEVLGLQRQLGGGEGHHAAGKTLAVDVEVEVLADLARHA